ncbi:MAG: peptide chain release factor 1 [Candidatus Dormiibacterota bacterium]
MTLPPALQVRLEQARQRRQELEERLQDPGLDPRELEPVGRELAQLRPVLELMGRIESSDRAAEEAQAMAASESDSELRAYLEGEARRERAAAARALAELRLQLLPQDPDEERDSVVEIRAGTGGEEAALFAADLLRMYLRYAERERWRVEMIDSSPSEAGGLKEVVLEVHGRGAYGHLKFESGVHRVQRVPQTESQGRVHTSAASVVVLPEAEDLEVDLREEDIKVDVFRSTGPGGQSVNTTDSAVRITHLPTGLVVTCQDEKSQHKNRAKAMRVLRSRLYDRMRAEQERELRQTRLSMVGHGDRSEKIRTYNFRENRVTDHRIDLTLYQLPRVLGGELELLVDPLRQEEQARKLAGADADPSQLM